MYTCELCGKQTEEGYIVVDLKSWEKFLWPIKKKCWVMCKDCGGSVRVDKKIK